MILGTEVKLGGKNEGRGGVAEYALTLQNGNVDIWAHLWNNIRQGVGTVSARTGLRGARCIQGITATFATARGDGDFLGARRISRSPKYK